MSLPKKKIVFVISTKTYVGYSKEQAFSVKLAIAHTTVMKWKEKYDAVVVKCYHGDRIKMSLPENFFLGRLPLLPGSHLGLNFSP